MPEVSANKVSKMTDKDKARDINNEQPDKDNLDWNTQNLMHHPEGMEKALADNISKMEQKTKEIIENGSIEEIEAALEKNLEELAALQKHMEKLANRDLSQV